MYCDIYDLMDKNEAVRKRMGKAVWTDEYHLGCADGKIRNGPHEAQTVAPEGLLEMSKNKYRNIRSGGRASKRENKRAQDLRLLEKIGEISDLEEQVKYELIPKQEGERAVTYTLDFRYFDKRDKKWHHEDSKGFKTQQYVIRRKLMLFVHGIRVEEV